MEYEDIYSFINPTRTHPPAKPERVQRPRQIPREADSVSGLGLSGLGRVECQFSPLKGGEDHVMYKCIP